MTDRSRIGGRSRTKEEWRPVVGYEGRYEVSSLGRVRSVARSVWIPATWRTAAYRRRERGRLLSPSRLRKGYRRVNLEGVAHSVHRLVLEAFVGPCHEGMEGCHCDGNPGNNAIDNLRWDTRKGNWDDRRKHGNAASTRKLSDGQVREIRLLVSSTGLTNIEIAARYGVHHSTVSLIRRGKVWKSVPELGN